jgi:hypothetical protein
MELKFKNKLKLPLKEMESKKENKFINSEAIEFVSYFLGCSTMLHIMHLQNSNPAVHKPLGDLYEEVSDIIDSVIEKHQGCKGALLKGYKNYDLSEYEGMSPLKYVQDLKEYLWEDRYKAFDKNDSAIQNEIDNLANALNQCLFHLSFNKPL